MTVDQFGGIARALIAALGGYLVGLGILDASTMTTIGGAVVTLAITAWSIYTNRPAKLL